MPCFIRALFFDADDYAADTLTLAAAMLPLMPLLCQMLECRYAPMFRHAVRQPCFRLFSCRLPLRFFAMILIRRRRFSPLFSFFCHYFSCRCQYALCRHDSGHCSPITLITLRMLPIYARQRYAASAIYVTLLFRYFSRTPMPLLMFVCRH